MTHPDGEHNGQATARLRELVASLSEADLARSLGGGWTVAMALGHLAFWDRRQRAVLTHYADTGVLLGSEGPEPHNPDELTNAALEPLLAALAPDEVGRLALEAAEAVDEAAASLEGATLAEVLAGEHAYIARRWGHREEHIAQIRGALGERG